MKTPEEIKKGLDVCSRSESIAESIDKEDRILTWVVIVPLSAFVFFAVYGAFTMLGMI